MFVGHDDECKLYMFRMHVGRPYMQILPCVSFRSHQNECNLVCESQPGLTTHASN